MSRDRHHLPPAIATLILGVSGTGKTRLAETLSQSWPKKFVASREDEELSGSSNSSGGKAHAADENSSSSSSEGDSSDSSSDHDEPTRIDYEGINDLENCTLTLDDVIRPSVAEEKLINRLLCYTRRHHNVNVFLLAHGVTKNNLNSLMPFFQRVIFTHDSKNGTSFKTFARRYYAGDLEDVDTIWQKFMSAHHPWQYLEWNQSDQSLKVKEDGVAAVAPREEEKDKRQMVEDGLKSVKNRELAMQIFDYIFCHGIKLKQLTKEGQLTYGGHTCNIVDLVHFPTLPNRRPPADVNKVYRAIQSRIGIPATYVLNVHMQN